MPGIGKTSHHQQRDQPCSTIAYTVYVSDTGYKRILDRLEQCKTEIRSIIHKDEEPPTQVYQVNLQLFPKTKKSEKYETVAANPHARIFDCI